MTEVSNGTTPGQAREGLLPFAGRVSDLVMIDKTQAQLFQTLGTRSLFHGLSGWPSLEEALAQRSREVLRKSGEESWASAGGVYGPDGTPTCLPMSLLAADVVRGIAADPGGLLWTDSEGVARAVRLVPIRGRDPGAFFGFALSWPGAAQLAGLRSPSGNPKRRQAHSEEVRRRLGFDAQRLRLAGRAEQLLWTIHWAVVTQRRSVVLLPDMLLGQVIWGGERQDWPQEWRHDLLQTFRSLMDLRLDVLRLSAAGWHPEIGAHSVAVADVEKLWVTRPEENYCRPACPMWGSPMRHSHFAVQAGYGFLGAMEKFATEETPEYRVYNFKEVPNSDAGEELREARNAGQLVSLSTPTALFGPAKWSGLSAAHHRIIQSLFAEVTRPLPPGRSGRPDHAGVIRKGIVPGLTPRSRVVCPLLDPKDRYITFGGNGDRLGMGYLIVGNNGRGWLDKCGYNVPQQAGELPRIVRSFLADLGVVCESLALMPVGLGPTAGDWLELDSLIALAGSHKGVEQLLAVHLRVYGPEDYLDRCRGHFERQGSFTSIPGRPDEEPEPAGVSLATDIRVRICLSGIKQVELAKILGVSQPRVSQMLNGSRPWPDSVRQRVEAVVVQRLAFADDGGEVA